MQSKEPVANSLTHVSFRETVAASIHNWIVEIFSDSDSYVQHSHDFSYTVVTRPNIKIFYKEEELVIGAWLFGEGIGGRWFKCDYTHPDLLPLLKQKLEKWQQIEEVNRCSPPRL